MHTWNTGDTITAGLLNSLEQSANDAQANAAFAAATALEAQSPGRGLLYNRVSPDGNQEIYRSNVGGTSEVRLTTDTTYQSWWAKPSPDGQRILFLRVPVAHSNYDDSTAYQFTSLWIMNADGSGATQIVAQGALGGYLGTPNWHPKGNKIVCFAGDAGTTLIHTVRDDGTQAATVTTTGISGGAADTSYSPDGNTIVFTCLKDIWSVPATGGTPTKLTTDGSTTQNYDPYFSPDGKQIAMLTQMAAADAGHPAGQWAIRIMNADGTGLTSIVNDGQANSKPQFSPDGRIFFHRLVQTPTPDTAWSLAYTWNDGTGTVIRLTDGSTRYGYPAVALDTKQRAPLPHAASHALTGSDVLIGVPMMVARSATDSSVVNSTAETTLMSQAIYPFSKTGTVYRLRAFGDLLNNTGASVTYRWRLYLGGTAILDPGAGFGQSSNAGRGKWVLDATIMLITSGAQQAFGTLLQGGGSGASLTFTSTPFVGYGTALEDTTASKNISLSMTLGTANANADFHLRGWTLEMVP